MKLRAYIDYRRRREALSYWRSVSDREVDFIVGDHTAIEVKASKRVIADDLRGLSALAEEKIIRNLIVVSEDPIASQKGGIRCLPWRRFLDELWADKLF